MYIFGGMPLDGSIVKNVLKLTSCGLEDTKIELPYAMAGHSCFGLLKYFLIKSRTNQNSVMKNSVQNQCRKSGRNNAMWVILRSDENKLHSIWWKKVWKPYLNSRRSRDGCHGCFQYGMKPCYFSKLYYYWCNFLLLINLKFKNFIILKIRHPLFSEVKVNTMRLILGQSIFFNLLLTWGHGQVLQLCLSQCAFFLLWLLNQVWIYMKNRLLFTLEIRNSKKAENFTSIT